MASKNNKRYKIRKKMSDGNHKNNRFNSPPQLISSWDELNGLENDNYKIVVEEEMYNGHIKSKHDNDFYMYLSTHTFYGSQYFTTTDLLRGLGFNVQLKNWDGETIYCER